MVKFQTSEVDAIPAPVSLAQQWESPLPSSSPRWWRQWASVIRLPTSTRPQDAISHLHIRMVCLVSFLFFRWWVLWALVACNDWFNCEPLQFSLHSRVKTTLLAPVFCCCNALALPGYSLVETETALWGCNRKRYSRLVEVEDTRYRHEIDEWVCFISNHIVSWAHLTTAFLKQKFVVERK
jgi:hypothetical protein